MTSQGYKKIEEITLEDYVLTHTNSFQKVTKVMNKFCDSLYEFNSYGTHKFKVTEEHPFYVRHKYSSENFSKPEWIKIKDIRKSDYIGIAINQKNEIPKWNGFSYTHHKTIKTKKELQLNNSTFWWLVGRYIGDGWRRITKRKDRINSPNYRTIICCDKKELSEITSKLDNMFNYSITDEGSINKIHIVNKELTLYLEQFGDGAKNKYLTSDIFNLPTDLLESFLEGYFSADGHYNSVSNLQRASSVSIKLMYGIQACVHKVYKRPCALYQQKRLDTSIIEGRTVNQNLIYTISFKKTNDPQDKAFYENEYIWVPFRKKKLVNFNNNVYNISVKNDESYTVYNLIVHNCTDLSVAGKQKGFRNEVGELTRSGLYYYGIDILKNKKPKYSIIENVKPLVSVKFKSEFLTILNDLDEAGYDTYYQVLNSKYFDIPQNRERVFIVSIRKDINQTFEFPTQNQLTKKRILDILDDNISEEYFCKDAMIDRINVRNKHPLKSDFDKSDIISLCNAHPSNNGCSGVVYCVSGIAPTLLANSSDYIIIRTNDTYRFLTESECFKLMGFSIDDYNKVKDNTPSGEIYKAAGNSIVVNVVQSILYNLLIKKEIENIFFS